MKLSVITITCREQPRFAEMLSTLLGSFGRRTNQSTELEWIIVDEKSGPNRWTEPTTPLPKGFVVWATPPLPSRHRQGDKLPAHNSARNAGLAEATGDYVVFLNDCTVVTRSWVATAELVAGAGLGWRVKAHVVNDLALPTDGVLKYRDHYDRLRPVAGTSVPGACWGAPRAKLLEIGGFDLAYDGEDKGHDLDAVLRLERVGVAFVTTEQAFCVRLRRTKMQAEISLRKESFNGARNQKLLNELARDRDRTVPWIVATPFAGPGMCVVGKGPLPDELALAPVDDHSPRDRRAERARERAARAERARQAPRSAPARARPPRPGRDAATAAVTAAPKPKWKPGDCGNPNCRWAHVHKHDKPGSGPEAVTQRIRPPLRPVTPITELSVGAAEDLLDDDLAILDGSDSDAPNLAPGLLDQAELEGLVESTKE
jgi:hypothetical protein